ncbi:bifunctional aldolase/short-chain dehydrogenase [Candidatus Ferrigenium straubiae]|jgi:rhamnose utilization protein RhaD (predicted bifunctional aldolase and dehydrogenase)/NAD(P)-dependent dehydrogenase (short-subunit alcohol dehydrogenase family)|uniref:bifunctional aldolase/short-chain dehydrogenase n=1 Tax=Candidatus Ferrigenium straubiae TaxID=2919506 RepID=UPI003F4AD810
MENLWNDTEAGKHKDILAERVYSSRLLGANTNLVLHGGGNTSVKGVSRDIFGEDIETLFVKGSGSDLATIEAKDFVAVRLDAMLKLSRLEKLSDIDMARELKLASLDPAAPAPSVEAILHALIPHRFVDHTHADAIVTITNTPDGEARIRELFGDEVIVLPYVMPGFYLAKLCAEVFPKQATPRTIGMVLMNHGIFSFGDTAKQAYDRMIDLVGRAEGYLQKHASLVPSTGIEPTVDWSGLPELRKKVSAAAGFPMLLRSNSSSAALAFARHSSIAEISQRGPATPDHIIRTKRLPLLGRDVEAYAQAYRNYFEKNSASAKAPLTMLDPAPRVILDAEFGLVSAGRSARDAQIVEDIYLHTQDIILRAEKLGGYRALGEAPLFSMEYWDLEQAKLKKAGAPKAFAGEVALVTGAASGIGRACVQSFLNRGAAVVGVDINPAIEASFGNRADYLGITADLTSLPDIRHVIEQALRHYGGLDMLVLNAGVFPGGRKIAALSDEEWRKVMAVNLDSNLSIMREVHPLLKAAPRHGRVVVNGSKNVPAPGPGAVAYSASKAALTQAARVAALEWGADGIRVNVVHPNAVFDTGIWTPEVLAQRAAHYGMSVDDYKRNNVLHEEVTSKDVAELIAEMCGPLFSKITGAQLPIDGGNERVI